MKRNNRIGAQLRAYEKQIVYIAGMLIVAFLSFLFGVFKGTGLSQEPIIVQQPINEPVVIEKEIPQEDDIGLQTKDCVFVGSVRGSKYYPPSCSFAKKIAKENLRCFTSDQDAIDKGYTRSTACK